MATFFMVLAVCMVWMVIAFVVASLVGGVVRLRDRAESPASREHRDAA